MKIKYPITIKGKIIKDYIELLDLFSSTCPDAPLNEQSEPDADEMIEILRR